jgi:serine/threonine-protein kinase RsbW/stage II sporulation protein AB (anti-sigma F factor)
VSTTYSATYEATPECIALVRNQMGALAEDCGLDDVAIGDVKLAVSEAATNALVHGYRNGKGTISVEASVGNGELVIAVGDTGLGMSPRTDSPGIGLGLPVIAKVARRLEILDDQPGTRLRMAFPCPRSPGPAVSALN